MGRPQFEAAKKYVFGRLRRELSPKLFYHGIHHTRDDVLPAAEQLAKLEGITGEDLLLLKTAALYHDIGYIEQYQNNEPIGERIASKSLLNFGYSTEQIKRIVKIIRATQLQMVDGELVQVPDSGDILQQLMCDADLDSLGREDFFVIGENLRRELKEYGAPKTLRLWYEGQLVFQEAHAYFTKAAHSLRDEGKQENIRELKEFLVRD